MASSLVLTGGAAFTKTLKDTQTQVGHGFAVGDVVRWDNVSQLYVKAKADTAANAEVLGVINAVNGNTFEITYCGLVTLSGLPASISGAPVLFLSSTTSGGLEASPPSALGTVVKPVLTRDKGNNYIVTNYLGTQIGGSSTIAVDEIQPVGTIMPFAGNAIPVTWLACDGSTHDRTEYSELYTKLCFTDGDQVPMYGYVVGITGAAAGYANIAAGDVVHFKKTTSAFAGNAPFDQQSNDEVRAQVLAVPNATVKYLQLSVIPKYSNGKFEFSNTLLGTITTNSNNYRVFSGTSSTLKTITGFTVTGVQILHFRTPDLRGRFALGDRSVAVPESTNEAESAFISSIGTYTMGSLGGEESHTLTSGEMPSHGHAAGTLSTNESGNHRHRLFGSWGVGGQSIQGSPNEFAGSAGNGAPDFNNNYEYNIARAGTSPEPNIGLSGLSGGHSHTINGSVASAGSNTPHNNMPPYLAVRYIIKAKPYTRAAIIDGVEIPYQNLLVRDLRTRSLGGNADADLIICTNKSTDAGLGVERIRVMGTDGSVGIGKTPAAGISLDVNGWAAFSGRVGIGRTDPQVALDVNGTAAFNVVGIGTRTPASGVALDIVGAARSSIALADYSTANAKTLTTKEYVDTRALGIAQTWQTFVIGTSANQRYSGTDYTNSSGKPIQVFVHTNVSSGITIKVGGVTIMSMNSGANLQFTNTFIVPNNTTYSVFTGTGTNNAPNQIYGWAELR